MSFSGTVVLNCAGIGSRLGLGLTKVLMTIDGISLLEWQLKLLENVSDLRVVVGYQANAVIEACSKLRKDILFVYNHRYFDTKTGWSLALGARYASEYVVSWDGDLVINPKDAAKCLDTPGEFLAYTKKVTDDAVFCDIDPSGYITSFSMHAPSNTHAPKYEWTGLCRLKRDKLPLQNSHVFQLIDPYLPLPGIEVQAIDIDTYNDYLKAKSFLKSWSCPGE